MTNNPLDRIKLKNPVHFLAVGFGSGLISPAPGTWGSLVGVIIGILLLQVLSLPFFILLTLIGFVIGIFLCQKTTDDMGVHDHGAIVWDEIIGVFMVLWAIPNPTWQWALIAFVLFRLFDISKPFPIRYFDQKLESGFGIMIDDILAAVYAMILIYLIRLF